MGRAPVDFINISTDMNTEVDAWTPASWTLLCTVRSEEGGEGEQKGRRDWGGGSQKDWGKGGKSAFTLQLIPSANTSQAPNP